MPKFTINLLEYFHKQDKSFFILLGILLSILIGVIDYVTLDFFMFEFYLLPIAIAVWFSERNVGIFVAFAAAISEISSDIMITPQHSVPWVHYWNFSLNLSFFIAVVYLLEFLKKTLIKLENVSQTERIINRQLHIEIEHRKETEEKLKTLASHDELTGCLNFRSTMEFLENEIVRSKRYQRKFSMIMIDIDYFKRINDEYGHLVGNDALIAFTNVVKNNVRNIDIVGRYGGEEFIIVLPETDPQYALVVLERIKNNLEQTKITLSHLNNAKEVTLKFSAGIAVFPHNAKDLKELIWVADNALIQAKKEGKNRAVLEKRKLIRLSPIPGTRIEIVDSPGRENVKSFKIANISKEGALILSTQDILDEEFLCRLYYPKNGSPFELTCKVKYKGKSDGLYRIGVYFPDISGSIEEELSKCILKNYK